MNLVMICIDCLRNDFISKNYGDTPFLDQLRDESLYFSNMHSTATTTTPCVASFFTGRYSEKNGVNSLEEAELSKNASTLAEKLSEAGLNTHALTTGPLVEKTGLNRGFDRYECRDREKTLFTDWEDELYERIDEQEEPFFLYLHLWELHEPLEVPEEFDKAKYGNRPYTRILSALDRKIEEIDSRLPEDTVLAIHGDHGESITWRGSFLQRWMKRGRTLFRYYGGFNTRPVERKLNQLFDRKSGIKDHFIEEGHGETVFDFTTNVPFMLKGEEIRTENVDEQVRQIDIFPTLLDLYGKKNSERSESESLLKDNLNERKAYIRACGTTLKSKDNWIKALRHEGLKYITYPNRDWNSELYKLSKDGRELRDVKDIEKKDYMSDEMPDEELQNTKDIEIKEKLEALGYK